MRKLSEKRENVYGLLIKLEELTDDSSVVWFWEIWNYGEKLADNSKNCGEDCEEDAMFRAGQAIDFARDARTVKSIGCTQVTFLAHEIELIEASNGDWYWNIHLRGSIAEKPQDKAGAQTKEIALEEAKQAVIESGKIQVEEGFTCNSFDVKVLTVVDKDENKRWFWSIWRGSEKYGSNWRSYGLPSKEMLQHYVKLMVDDCDERIVLKPSEEKDNATKVSESLVKPAEADEDKDEDSDGNSDEIFYPYFSPDSKTITLTLRQVWILATHREFIAVNRQDMKLLPLRKYSVLEYFDVQKRVLSIVLDEEAYDWQHEGDFCNFYEKIVEGIIYAFTGKHYRVNVTKNSSSWVRYLEERAEKTEVVFPRNEYKFDFGLKLDRFNSEVTPDELNNLWKGLIKNIPHIHLKLLSQFCVPVQIDFKKKNVVIRLIEEDPLKRVVIEGRLDEIEEAFKKVLNSADWQVHLIRPDFFSFGDESMSSYQDRRYYYVLASVAGVSHAYNQSHYIATPDERLSWLEHLREEDQIRVAAHAMDELKHLYLGS